MKNLSTRQSEFGRKLFLFEVGKGGEVLSNVESKITKEIRNDLNSLSDSLKGNHESVQRLIMKKIEEDESNKKTKETHKDNPESTEGEKSTSVNINPKTEIPIAMNVAGESADDFLKELEGNLPSQLGTSPEVLAAQIQTIEATA